jgi:hypothetical protein
MVLTYSFHDYNDEKNNGLSFYHNFYETNVKFYNSKRLKIYIILKNNYVYVDNMIIKYNLNICWSN